MANAVLTKKKQELSRKLFAQLTKKQAGAPCSVIDQVLKSATLDLDSEDIACRKHGTTVILKLFDHIMPKETGPLVNINNNKLAFNGKSADDVLMKLGEFMADRQSKIEAIESREQNRELEIVAPPKKSPKLPANSPLSPKPSE
jgi:hypothetical protein